MQPSGSNYHRKFIIFFCYVQNFSQVFYEFMLFGNTIIIRLKVFCGTLLHEPQPDPRPARYHTPRCHEQPIAPIDGHYLLATLHRIHDVRSHVLR